MPHRINKSDASHELAGVLAAWIDSSTLHYGWEVTDEGTPGHFLKYNNKVHFIIFPKEVQQGEMLDYVGTFEARFLATSPDFFEKLGTAMMPIQIKSFSMLWKPIK